jgi:2-dehydro-3-deoxygluconokinase
MSTVVAFGELMMRLSPPGHERFLQSPMLRTWFGGSEANVAVGLAHLGVGSRFVTRLPANPLGDGALAAMRAEGVDTTGIVRGGERLGLYFVEPGVDVRGMRVVYDRAHSAFSTLTPEMFSWPALLANASWFHVSGITPALGAGPAQSALDACAAARARGIPVSIDLNYRPALWSGRDPRPTMRALVDGCDVLIGNAGAIEAMLGIAAGPQVAEQVADETRARQVILTHRDVRSASEHRWSATVFDAASRRQFESRPYVVQVVDRVGGGDSFVAAWVYARLAQRSLEDALAFATAASALKLTIPGDFNRVTVDEVDHVLSSHR